MRRTLRAIGRPRTSAGADSAEDARRAPLRPLPVLPRRRVASRAARHRPCGDANGRDGSHIGGRRDPRERGDRERSSTPTRSARRRATGVCFAPRPRSAARSSPLPAVEGIPLEIAVPAPLRAQLLEIGPLEGEHRHAVDRLHPLLRHGRDHRDRRARGGRGRARRSRPRRAGGRGRAQGDLPRERHRSRRRTDHPRLRRAADLRRRRGADAPNRARRSSTRACRSRFTSG